MMNRAGATLVVLLLVAACGGSSGPGGGGGGDIPPGNVVWFGSSYDPTSLGVVGKTASITQGSPVAAVAHLFTARPPGQVKVAISSGSRHLAPVPVAAGNNGDSSDVFALDLTGAGLDKGTWVVSFTDASGRILASGFLTVTAP